MRARLVVAAASRRCCTCGLATWLALGLAGSAACSRPITLDWRRDLKAPSVCTPLVTAAFIAVGHELGLTLLEPSGALRCTFDAHGEVVGRPATDGRLVYFGSTNYNLYAVDQSCKQVWKLATRDRVKSDTLYLDGRVYASSYDGHVYALDAQSGARRWVFPPPQPELDATMAALAAEVAGGKGKVASSGTSGGTSGDKSGGTSGDKSGGTAAGRTDKSGAPPVPAAPLDVGDFSYSSPIVAEGVLYAGNLDGYVYALDVDSGALRWRFATGGAVTSTPLVAQGLLYVGSNDGNVYALSLPSAPGETPRVRWKHPTGDWVNSSARLANGVIYVGSNDRHLYALDAESGVLRWQFDAKGPIVAVPSVYDNLVVVAGGSGDGRIYALERASGSLFWQAQTAGKVEADPVIVGNRLYVASADRHLYAFEIRATAR